MDRKSIRFLALWLALTPLAQATNVDLADKPMASGTSGEVKPNVMLVLDDSGSMSFSYMPDNAVAFHGKYGYVSSQCNSIYYDPSVTYHPPVDAAGIEYPNAVFVAAQDDGFATGKSPAKTNLNSSFYANRFSPESANNTYKEATHKPYTYSALGPSGAYYYLYEGTQTKKDYLDTNSTFYRECNSNFDQSPGSNVFSKRRLATTMTTTIVVSGSSNTTVSSIKVGGVEIMSGTSARSNKSSTVASNIRAKIGLNGYTATSSGSTITITGPASAANHTPVITRSGSMTFTTDVFPETDPAALTNFANWYSFYRARILTAKTAVGRAFSTLSEPTNYRVGYRVLNTGVSHAIDDFCTGEDACSQRTDIYDKLYNTTPSGGTPLQKVLAEVGRMYAGKLGSDPVQYSCQQNFTILTTDGFWNGSDKGKQINGSSNIGNEDGAAARPMWDGTNAKGSGGSTGSLADIAMYYYETDLRTPTLGNCTGTSVDGQTQQVCENNVPGSGVDKANHQHMTTFTLGLGVSGVLEYCENYDSGGCADFEAIRQGTKNWPVPAADQLTTVDDLWHAAVNGRGKYFSAQSPESMAKGVQKALAGVSARTASAAAAATSNLEPIAGDNDAYTAMYTTVDWDGDITARSIDLSAGSVSDTSKWSAQAMLDSRVGAGSDTRNVYFNDGGSLVDFKPGNLGAQITLNYFSPGPDNPNGQLSQYPEFSPAEEAQATQTSIINFLRGQSQHEDESENTWKLYRDRKHVLGDIVNAAPVYVRKPPFAYSDDNYAQFAALNASRQSVVYAGANDGMLHAFNADTGAELWAFIPATVIPQLYKLADKSYANNHRFYVDGPIVIGDYCPIASCAANQWKTILVGGLGKGGRAYYALDVTNPASPVLLWEFTDNNLGYTFGNPVITKVNGQWVVIVASGYNNNAANEGGPSGDGKGRLFVLQASNGTKLAEIITDGTTDPSLSGIAKISNWVDDTIHDNSTEHVYGGDLGGNVWRFNVLSNTSLKVTTIGKGDVGTQPITTRPELAEVRIDGTPTRVLLIGTGQYLGTSDISSSNVQSLYAIKDDLSSPPYGDFRTHPDVVAQELSSNSGRQVSYSGMEADSIGWYMDFGVKNGERVNVDPKYQMGWWVVPTNIPDPNVCNIGGTSWLYFIDPWPTQDRESEAIWAVSVGNALIVGINVIKLPNGKIVTITTTSDAKYPAFGNPPTPSSASLRRINWRELTR